MIRNEENGSCLRTRKRYWLFCGFMLNFLLIAVAPGISWAATPQIIAGYAHSVELKSDGTVWTWGDNLPPTDSPYLTTVPDPVGCLLGLGSGFTASYSSVAEHVAGISGVIAISAGENHTLALKSDGTVWAWGANDHGQLGNNSLEEAASYSNVPVQVSIPIPLTDKVTAIAAGTEFSLAVDSNGAVWAWGRNDIGQLGSSTLYPNDQYIPVQITMPATAAKITQIAAGIYHALAVDANGAVWAWGSNSNGQLGDNSTTDSTSPVQVKGLSGVGNISGVTNVAAGAFYSLALMSNGTVAGWGQNAAGQLGNGSNTDSAVPVSVINLPAVTAISAGFSQTLALTSAGAVWAWGDDSAGELGNGTETGSNTPQQNGFTGATSCSAGYFFSLALKINVTAAGTDWTAWAWGDNSSGQLGNAAFEPLPDFGTPSPTPSVVIPLGDLIGTGTVTTGDALRAQRIAIELVSPTAFELLVGEMNGDGQIASQITTGYAFQILRAAVGL
jgi:alpha-tubulin suppressor-like RCC1 family protein